jgi:ubiquinone/menaquinone biosynthesis C-methylase UbiE/uncharacterized protein YbaR (Trm112 family)
MNHDLLPYLSCSTCGHAPLVLIVGKEAEEAIVEGALRCEHCGQRMPIMDGIVDALKDAPVPWTPAQLTNYSPLAAWGYERLWRWQALSLLTGSHFPFRDELRLVCDLLEPARGGLLLDVACSTGLYARAMAMAAPGATVVAIDHSWAMLREAQRYARREGRRISFVRAAAQALPFRSGSATGYGMGGSLNEIGDITATLREARRVLAKDGRYVSMHLLAAESRGGRLLQRLLATGGIEFPTGATFERYAETGGLRPATRWRRRVVEISLLLPDAAPPAMAGTHLAL